MWLVCGQWHEYIKAPEAKRNELLNVVSLELAGTPLASMISPPAAVREIELIGQVWPKNDSERPEVSIKTI